MPDQHLLHAKGIRESVYKNGRYCGAKITVFDPAGMTPLVVTLTDALDRIIERRFHAADMTLAQRHEFLYSLDGRLRRKQVLDAGGRLAESIFFDGKGNVIKTEKLDYDVAGNLFAAATYNAAGLLQQEVAFGSDGHSACSFYDDDGHLAEIDWRDERGVVTRKTLLCRDSGGVGTGKLEFDYLPDGSLFESRSYDVNDCLTQVDNYRETGQSIRNSYNKNGQLVDISYLDASHMPTRQVLLHYDAQGNCTGKQELRYRGDGRLPEASGGGDDDAGRVAESDCHGHDAGAAAPDGVNIDEGQEGSDTRTDGVEPAGKCSFSLNRNAYITESHFHDCDGALRRKDVTDTVNHRTERFFYDDKGRLTRKELFASKRRVAHREFFYYWHDAYTGKKIIIYTYAGLLEWLGIKSLARRHASVDLYDANGSLLLHKDLYRLVW